jgi:hypothetical protein
METRPKENQDEGGRPLRSCTRGNLEAQSPYHALPRLVNLTLLTT